MPNIKFSDAKEFEFVWRNNGLNPQADVADKTTERVEMSDALSHSDAPYFFPITVENYVREAVEPLLIGTSLLQRINYKIGTVISLPSIGAMYAADIDEGMEYPERSLNFGPGVQIATIGKSGLAFKLTEEMKRYSQYDVVAMHLKAAGRALARHKEQKFFSMLSKTGITIYDNVNPSASVFGVTTGRNMTGAANGSLNVDDLFQAHGQVTMNGFTGDTIIVHPMTFAMFATDPVLRAFAMNHGGGSWYSGPSGIKNPELWSKGQMGGLGPNGGNTGTHPNALAGSAQAYNNYSANAGGMTIPGYYGLPLRVLVSPFVPYNPVTKLSDIYVVDSSNIGALIVDEEPSMDEVPDKLRDIIKIKIRERYALAVLNEGKAVGVIKNVKITPNAFAPQMFATVSTITEIVPGTQLLNTDGTLHA